MWITLLLACGPQRCCSQSFWSSGYVWPLPWTSRWSCAPGVFLKPLETHEYIWASQCSGQRATFNSGVIMPFLFQPVLNNFTGTSWFLRCENRLVHFWCVLVIPSARNSPAFLTAFVGESSAWVLLDPPQVGRGLCLLWGRQRQQANSHLLFPEPCSQCFPHKWDYHLRLSCQVIKPSLFAQKATMAQNQIQPLGLTHL